MPKCPDAILKLVERFQKQSDQVLSPDYNETQLRIDFVNPMFAELGWDMSNAAGYAEQYREVVHEDRVKVAGQTKAPDYSFRIGGHRKFFLEAKKPAINIKGNWEPAYQLRRYAWSAKLACSVLTDFEEFAVYDARIQPKMFDKASIARREFISYTDYESKWDFISGTFSKDAVLRGEFDRYCEAKKGRGAESFDDVFLNEIEEWRKNLASNLALRNDTLDEPSLNFAVQRIIDRIIFLRIAEDRGTETVDQLKELLEADEIYPRLVSLFRRADERYNSGLFHFAKERDRDESPDTLTPKLDVDNKTLKSIIKALYYPQSPYEFSMVSADILGSVYERFLGKVITLTAGHRAKIDDKPEVRKAGGVYYTPIYIVDYIVENTVGKLFVGKSPKEAAKLTILDPACGSGSFLIGAYQFLLDWYFKQYIAADPAALATGKRPLLRQSPGGGWCLTISERKRILLDHIHGVDLDGAAVEVTKLNLLLKCLEGETSQSLGFEQRLFRERALPDLGKNILCGNSLIGTDIIGTEAWTRLSEEDRSRTNPFDYERAFPNIFKGKGGGFDAVIGNPPYLAGREWSEELWSNRQYFLSRFSCMTDQYDLYALFIQRAVSLLKNHGSFSFITPNTWLNNEHYLPLREWVASTVTIRQLGDFRNVNVFEEATVLPIVIIADREVGAESEVIVETFESATSSSIHRTSPSLWRRFENFAFNLSLATEDVKALERIEKPGIAVEDIADVRFGVKVYQRGKGRPPQKGPEAAQKLFERQKSHSKDDYPYLRGETVNRYLVGTPRTLLFWGPHLAEPRTFDLFEGERILVRRIVGTRLILCPTRETAIADQLLHTVKPRPDSNCDYRFLAACLGSSLTAYYFRKRYNRTEKTFPEIRVAELRSMPLPKWTEKPKPTARVIGLVDAMLLLQSKASSETLPQRQEQIRREIDAIDRQIDELVYELYGLSENEIAVVRAATPAP